MIVVREKLNLVIYWSAAVCKLSTAGIQTCGFFMMSDLISPGEVSCAFFGYRKPTGVEQAPTGHRERTRVEQEESLNQYESFDHVVI